MRGYLNRHAVKALLHGRYARLGGKTVGNRAKHLVEIASAYTRDELLMEPGIGEATVTKIQLWLEKRGCGLRSAQIAPNIPYGSPMAPSQGDREG